MKRIAAKIGTGTPTTIAEAGHEIARLEESIGALAKADVVSGPFGGATKKQHRFLDLAHSRLSFLYGYIRGVEKQRCFERTGRWE